MSDEIADLRRKVLLLEGKILGYKTLENIVHGKSDQLFISEMENKFLKTQLIELKRSLDEKENSCCETEGTNNTLAKNCDGEDDKECYNTSYQEKVPDEEHYSVQGFASNDIDSVINHASQEKQHFVLGDQICDVKEQLREFSGDDEKELSGSFVKISPNTLQTEIVSSMYQSFCHDRVLTNIPGNTPTSQHKEVSSMLNVPPRDQVIITDDTEQHQNSMETREVISLEDNVFLHDKLDDIHYPSGHILSHVIDSYDANGVECETSGVHLLARSSDNLVPVLPPHAYVNIKTTDKLHGCSTSDKAVEGVKHSIPQPCVVDDKLNEIFSKSSSRKCFEISLSEGADSEEIAKRMISLLKCVNGLEEECSVLRGRILALEKENKYLRKCVFHSKILDINVVKSDNPVETNVDYKTYPDVKLLKRYNESQDVIKQLNNKLSTMKASMQQVLQHGNVNVAEKDKALKELKRKYIEERSRRQELAKKYALSESKHSKSNHGHTINQESPVSSQRTDSIIVTDLLTEINVLHQQMVVLTDDYREERKDKSRLKTSQSNIERKLTDVKTRVVNLESQLDSSERNLQDALRYNDRLQERIRIFESSNQKTRKALPMPPTRQTSDPVATEASVAHLPGSWACNSCTYINHPQRTVCELCGLLKKPPRPARRHTSPITTGKTSDAARRANFHGNSPIYGEIKNGNSPLSIPQGLTEGASGISPLCEQSSLWNMQEEQIQLYSKPYRLIPRGARNYNESLCDTLNTVYNF